MNDAPSKADRMRIRQALSDVFVDNEVDYPSIAKAIKSYEASCIEHIFFNEVAPVCYSNLLSPVPPIWAAFDASWLESEIEKMLDARDSSVLRRLKDRVLVAYLRWRLDGEWRTLEAELRKHR